MTAITNYVQPARDEQVAMSVATHSPIEFRLICNWRWGAVSFLMLVGCAGGPTQNIACGPDQSRAAISSPTVKFLSLNIGHGRNTAWNQMLVSRQQTYDNLDTISALLDETGSDIVALQEADAASRWSGNFDHVEYLLEQTDYSCFVHGRHKDSWIAAFGTALLSRATLQESASIPFAPSPPTNTKGFVRSSINWHTNGRTIVLTVVSVHLDFSRKSVRESQVKHLVTELSTVDSPLIILGDFNSEWSDKNSSVQALADALRLNTYLPDDLGLGTYKETAGKRLDWILISQSLVFIDYKVLPDVVSDHLAVYAELGLRAGE